MQIGKLATLTGVSVRMLRYYEEAGLLIPERTETGYRRYTVDDVSRVERILVLNRAGFTLPTIIGLLNCVNSGTALCDTLKNKIQDQLQEIERQFDDLKKSRALLQHLLVQS